MKSHWSRRALSPICPVSLVTVGIWTQTHTQGEHHMEMTAEVRVTQLRDAGDFCKPPKAGREAWDRASLAALRRKRPCSRLDLGLLAFRP